MHIVEQIKDVISDSQDIPAHVCDDSQNKDLGSVNDDLLDNSLERPSRPPSPPLKKRRMIENLSPLRADRCL